jgi:hypothetical protein
MNTPLRNELTARLQILLHRYCSELAKTTRELGPQIAEHVAALRALELAEAKPREAALEMSTEI